jgi:hypothetical protein
MDKQISDRPSAADEHPRLTKEPCLENVAVALESLNGEVSAAEKGQGLEHAAKSTGCWQGAGR